MIQLTMERGAVLVPVKVVPGAPRSRIVGEWNGRIRVAVAAVPEKGKANAELTAFLAKLLSLRRGDVTVVAGHASPLKTVRIQRVALDAVRAVLQPPRS